MASHAAHSADHHADHHQVDDWHHHSAAEGEPQQEHGGIAKAGVIFAWFLGGIVFLVATIVVIIMYFDKYSTTQRILLMESQPAKEYWSQFEAHRATEIANIAPQGYQIIDPAKRTARPPLDVTMRNVVDQYQKLKASK